MDREASDREIFVKTPRTRLRWSTLAEWIAAWRTLKRRHENHISAATHAGLRAHVEALPANVIESGSRVELDELELELRKLNRLESPRREHGARIFDAIDRARHARRHRAQPLPELAAPDEAP